MSLASTHRKPIVLTLLGVFWPGSDSSGPNQSFRAMAAALRDEFDFRVIARDRPFTGLTAPVATGTWFDRGDYRVLYCEATASRMRALLPTLRATPHDLLALNSFFDREASIPALLARRAGLISRKPTILSPRGEFSSGALALGRGRKAAWIRAARLLGLTRDITYHAASAAEHADVVAVAPAARACVIAPNIRPLLDPVVTDAPSSRALRLAFIGRISPVKGLDVALAALAKVRSPVVFDIFGPQEDMAHWRRCETLMAALPPHVEARWRGEVTNADVPAALARTALFFLPSRSENFGHAIFEALSCGVPALIGHETPWHDLEGDVAGFNRALEAQALATAIDDFAAMSMECRARFRRGARARAERFVQEGDAIARWRAMLRASLSASHAHAPARHGH